MIDRFLFPATVVAALGSGLIAGVFFAFSTFVMKALTQLPAPAGIAAMQSINVAAITPVFMTVLFGPALACVALAVTVAVRIRAPWPFALLAVAAVGMPLAGVGYNAYHVTRRGRSSGSQAGHSPGGPDPIALAMGYATAGREGCSSGRRFGRSTACPSCGHRLADVPGHCPKCRTPV